MPGMVIKNKNQGNKPSLFPGVRSSIEPTIRFVEFEHRDWKGYTLIEGFPGMGLVGTITTKYLVDNIDFKEIGHLHSEVFMPIIRIHRGIPVFPSRIYVNDKHKLIVLISEQVIPRPYIPRVAQTVISWILGNGISRVISLAGIQTGQKDVKVYGIAANAESRDMFKGLDIEMIEDGITTGITALMMLHLRESNVKAISMLGNVTIGADYKAAAELIKRLNKLFSFNLKVDPLYEQAKKTEQEIISQLRKVQETQQQEDQADMKNGPSYYA
ncbi:MAG: PAC2 family protein [Candidatus Diapherotrites archaeon]